MEDGGVQSYALEIPLESSVKFTVHHRRPMFHCLLPQMVWMHW